MSTCFHFETTGSGLEIIGEWSIQRKSRTLFRAHAKKAARDGGCFEVTRISSFTTGQILTAGIIEIPTKTKKC